MPALIQESLSCGSVACIMTPTQKEEKWGFDNVPYFHSLSISIRADCRQSDMYQHPDRSVCRLETYTLLHIVPDSLHIVQDSLIILGHREVMLQKDQARVGWSVKCLLNRCRSSMDQSPVCD